MKTMCKMLKRDSKGFTLVELMVVLLIIGILIAIAIPIYNSTQKNAKQRACDANIRTIEGAAAQYYSTVGEWPSMSDLTTATDDEDNRYIKENPQCPFGENLDENTVTYEIDENTGEVRCLVNHDTGALQSN
ncbi:MAG: prepilin-type N-terminal cleavage/methylation domain-containing protein [Syntrophomonadaceae bacterium]|nr:prepilin-type N-terminal cleavage/methylation domain-containing protein [Syntrophomonadaceae bacterium]